MRIGILMGGRSLEKEVSFNSGRTVYDHIDRCRYEPLPIFQTMRGELFILPLHFLYRGKIADFEQRLHTEAQCITWDDLPKLIDFMYIATHGQYAEDGRLQGILELLGIPYLGAGVLASALRIDKITHKKILHAHGIKVPRYYPVYVQTLVKESSYQDHAVNITQTLPGPWIVKPASQGSSIGVQVVFDEAYLADVLRSAATVDNRLQSVIVEEKFEGMEFSCVVLVDKRTHKKIPLIPTEIELEKGTHVYDYNQKYMPGRALLHTPARCSSTVIEKIQSVCVKVMEILEFTTIARIDGFVTQEQEIIIFDPNSLSGMGPSSFLFRQAACNGFSHKQLINHLIVN